jgi:uncharacterized protein YbjQ (UPF0145 family)
MICPVCGSQEGGEGPECLVCHTRFTQEAIATDLEIPPTSAIEMFENAISNPGQKAVVQDAPPEIDEDSKKIQEEDQQLQDQLAKMEEEKQRLLELKRQRAKQLQEIKAKEEKKKVQKKETEIDNVVDKFKNILVTSLPTADNRPILEFKGLIVAQVLIKTDVLETAITGLKDAAGLRQTPYYDNLKKGFNIGLTDLKIEASKLGANAVIGVNVHEQFLKENVMILSFSGTAVIYQADAASLLG